MLSSPTCERGDTMLMELVATCFVVETMMSLMLRGVVTLQGLSITHVSQTATHGKSSSTVNCTLSSLLYVTYAPVKNSLMTTSFQLRKLKCLVFAMRDVVGNISTSLLH